MNFVGLDLSFTETGVVVITHEGDVLCKELIKTNSKDKTEERIIHIGEEIFAHLAHFDLAHMVYIEDKFVGKNKKQVL
jgi:Holliday junction resolvasome RuvABC endonuclease subunit